MTGHRRGRPSGPPQRWLTPDGATGRITDYSVAWSQLGGDVLLVCLEDQAGNLVGWYEPAGLIPLTFGQLTLFDAPALVAS